VNDVEDFALRVFAERSDATGGRSKLRRVFHEVHGGGLAVSRDVQAERPDAARDEISEEIPATVRGW
jgi:hypothetical protein